ncbi:MAG: hypothetical protein LBL49_06100 [Clostridiales Family XIII bacterium]|jgi:hypothetical protein|nr:hypothetical protein [Clostridiales Family XIII bacterium]
MQEQFKKKRGIGGLKISRAACCLGGVIMLTVLLIAVFPVSQAAAAFGNPSAKVNNGTVSVNFDVSGAPEDGVDARLIVVEKTDATGEEPPADTEDEPDTVRLDSTKLANGENSIDIPIESSLQGAALRIFIVADDGSATVFVDVDGETGGTGELVEPGDGRGTDESGDAGKASELDETGEPGGLDESGETGEPGETAETDGEDKLGETGGTGEPGEAAETDGEDKLGETGETGELTEEEFAVLENAEGVTLSGRVKSFNPRKSTTIQLMKDDVEVDRINTEISFGSGQIEQSFEFQGVSPGTYSLLITKQAHTKFTVKNIIVDSVDVDLTQSELQDIRLMSLRSGDINEEGMINDGDLTLLWRKANYDKNIVDVSNPLGDLNGDGMINDGDLTILWLVSNYNKGAVVIDMTDPNGNGGGDTGGDEESYTVVFKDWDGSVLDTQSTMRGSNAVPPVPPIRSGFLFIGWDGSYYDITSDTVLTAIYTVQEGLNVFGVSNAAGKPGDTVKVIVSLGGTVNAYAYDMRLAYDHDALEYVSHSAGEEILASHRESEHMIAFNYVDFQNRTSPMQIMDVSFKIKSTTASSASVYILPVEVRCRDPITERPIDIDHSEVNGTVSIN